MTEYHEINVAPSVALVTLHLQNEVIDPVGVIGRRGVGAVVAAGLVRNVVTLRRRADSAGSPVYHVVYVRRIDGSCTSTAPALCSGARIGFAADTWGTRVPDALVEPSDRFVEHDTMSAFSGTNLAETLFGTSITDIVLAGVSTHLVVAATAFAAADLGLNVIVAADCCASPDMQTHLGALAQLAAVAEIRRVVA